MTDWPNETDPADLGDLTGPLRNALTQLYTLKRTKKNSVNWSGPNLTLTSILCCFTNIAETLNNENLKYHQERQRDPLEMVLTCAIQLGVEQGARLKNQENKHTIFLAESYWKWLKKLLEAIETGNLKKIKELKGLKDAELMDVFFEMIIRGLGKPKKKKVEGLWKKVK